MLYSYLMSLLLSERCSGCGRLTAYEPSKGSPSALYCERCEHRINLSIQKRNVAFSGRVRGAINTADKTFTPDNEE